MGGDIMGCRMTSALSKESRNLLAILLYQGDPWLSWMWMLGGEPFKVLGGGVMLWMGL